MVWHYHHGCHAHFTEGSASFKHITRNPTKNQNFSKILFECFHLKPEASKRYMQHFSICNIKRSEKFSWYLPVHLISGVPVLHKYIYRIDFNPFHGLSIWPFLVQNSNLGPHKQPTTSASETHNFEISGY